MAIEFKKASRTRIPVKIELFGPPGSGKTWSSLLIAKGMNCKNVCLIDTEQSASLYDEHFDFVVAEIHPDDYKNQHRKLVQDFCDTFKAAVNDMEADCIIIDSLTHIWEAVKNYVSSLGGKYTDWNKGTPLWQQVIKMILSCPVPVIVCSRAAFDDVIESKEVNGKTTYAVKRLGTKADVRGNSDYEFTTVLSLDMNHNFKATKDRTGLFANTIGDDGEPCKLTIDTGKELRAWMSGGVMVKQELEEVIIAEEETKTSKLSAKVKEVTPVKDEPWKKTANQFLDLIEITESREELADIEVELNKFLEEIPKEAAEQLKGALIEQITKVEAPY